MTDEAKMPDEIKVWPDGDSGVMFKADARLHIAGHRYIRADLATVPCEGFVTIADAVESRNYMDEGEHCQKCTRAYKVVYWLPEDIWSTVTGKYDGSGLYCPDCIHLMAQDKGIYLEFIIAQNNSQGDNAETYMTPATKDALEALERIRKGGEVTGCYETIRQALARQAVDVDALKKDPRINEGNGNVGEDAWCFGWNDCIDHLAAQGYLITPAANRETQ